MRILKSWQNQLRNRFLQKKIFNLDSRRSPVTFESAQSVGILFNATEQANRSQIIQFANHLKKGGKAVTIIGYLDNKQDASAFSFKAYNKNDIDWLGRPKKEILEKYAEKTFDILICIYQDECVAIDYIAALSKAHLRVGPNTEQTYCYDLIIDTSKNRSIQHFLKEVDFYLHKINKKYEPANI